MKAIPEDELLLATRQALARPELYDSAWHIHAYEQAGLRVAADPFDEEIVDDACRALEAGNPLSVIRVGDGEMNLATFGVYQGTPTLDRFTAAASIAKQADTFRLVDDHWLYAIREMMIASIAWADAIGVLGVWHNEAIATDYRNNLDRFMSLYSKRPKGIHGDFRARSYMPRLASAGLLTGTMVCSAYLYFAVLDQLDRLISLSEKILLITNRSEVVPAFRRKYPDKQLSWIEVGSMDDERRLKHRHPFFLSEVAKKLPAELTGTLCLVGAGPWALIYCRWIKERGGVAIDLGSGFDLLAGRATRPVFRHVSKDIHSYRMVDPDDAK